ncbi:amidohydrolase family protein [Modestobacter sp. VKM Ac-2986]|uniref:amidohydrolase family protein n=1 Tax=Modestobacter sp. VKM Ac-2986 TaxID=3004140 RepID=UPI0022A9FAE3|nr:amidohydrolase family protein [Modestobacter sp. VKM Ac-2986]MCZ2829059.1 amidohydrolase family protein [Modestobacter sp. VKM Ac-2986]
MLIVRGARVVVTGETELTGADVVCSDDGLVTAAAEPGAEVLDATGCVVTPGLVNAHHHLLQTAFRTLPGTRGVPMAQWLPTMATAYAAVGVDDELAHAAASAGLAEALLCGVTTVADHHLTWPADLPDDGVGIATAAATAARELGARLVFVRGSARDDPQDAAASAEAVATALVPPGGVTEDGALQVAVGPAGVHSDAPETFTLLAEVAARHGLRRRTQANEQVDVVVAAERYGRRPLELLDEWGWLAPDVTLAHLCAVTAAEVARLATTGVTATHAPGCDLPMGWGVAPMAALADAGVPVGLGTSGGGSNDAGHLLADARLALQVAPLAGRPVSAREVLGWATRGSADGLGRADLGRLTVGARADLVCWDVTGVADTGVADPVAGLLWASPGRRPRHVVVGGRVVVRDGVLQTRPEADVVAGLTGLLGRRR